MITLDENYSIEIDSNNFTLKFEEERQITRKGKLENVTSKDEWHFGQLKHALSKYLNQAVKPAQNVSALYKKLIEVESNISTIK